MAKMIIEQNEQFLGNEVTEKAKEVIDREATEETKGGSDDEKKKKTRRTRKTI